MRLLDRLIGSALGGMIGQGGQGQSAVLQMAQIKNGDDIVAQVLAMLNKRTA